jgi:hypothetical protein
MKLSPVYLNEKRHYVSQNFSAGKNWFQSLIAQKLNNSKNLFIVVVAGKHSRCRLPLADLTRTEPDAIFVAYMLVK